MCGTETFPKKYAIGMKRLAKFDLKTGQTDKKKHKTGDGPVTWQN